MNILRFAFAGFVALAVSAGTAFAQDDGITISIMIGGSSGVDSVRAAAQSYMAANPGITVEVLEGPERTDELLAIYQLFFDRGSGVDVLTLDVIWPGDLGDFMVDLYQFDGYREAVAGHFPAIIDNNTTLDGELLAIPWFTDAGLLYYRTDLLDKYGFDGPPATWAELESMARTIQEGERSEGNESFWGFVFQGRQYEGLTVDALEWVASNGGGTFISPDGVITANNPAAIEILDRVASWIDDITLPGVLGFAEEEARNFWQAGNAAFMRNWPYVISLANQPGSPVAGRVGVAPLPAGSGADGRSVAGLGGWGLGVPSYSEQQAAAADFALFLSSLEQQKRRAVQESFAPTYPELYRDPEVLAANPFFEELLTFVENAVPRPSAVTSPNYSEVTKAIYRAVHSVLAGQQTAEEAMLVLSADLESITGLPVETRP